MFFIQNIEVSLEDKNSPLTAQEVKNLVGISADRVNLFKLNLSEVEKKILVNPWIKEARIEKKFPNTLIILIHFKKAQALFQNEKGELAYVDEKGQIFGKINLNFERDLPTLSGFAAAPQGAVLEALGFLRNWSESNKKRLPPISDLIFDPERGYRVILFYQKNRTLLELGVRSNLLENSLQLEHLGKVFEYLREKNIASRQIWANSSKKIIVKIPSGS